MIRHNTGWLAMMAAAGMAAAVEFHVAPGGGAMGLGSAEFPFGTLEQARDAAAEAKRQGQGGEGITVRVHGGRYERRTPFVLGPENGGVTYRRVPGETPVLSGALAMPLDAFAPVTDEAVLARLPEAARRRVRVANLRAARFEDYGQFPDRFRGGVPVLEVYCDGERMELARWPNAPDWAVIARIVDRGSTGGKDEPPRPGTFRYADPRHARWADAPDAYLHGYWCYDWFDEAIRIGSIDPEAGTVTLAAPHAYGIGRARSARRYYAFNLLEELDAPGEYYLDRDRGLLYFWPPRRAKGPAYLTVLAEPAIVVNGASDLRFEGLTIEHVRQGGIEIRDSVRVAVAGCTVRHTGTYGISISGGSDCRVDTCDIYDTGAGGILLAGGDRRTLEPARHRATNNHIRRFARRQRTYAAGIHLAGVGHRVDQNLIHDAPHSAILASANDCLIEYNEVHDVCLETDDCGAFYKGRNPAWQGNVLRFNFWHHIGTPLGHGNNAIYFDDGDVGETVFGNVFYRAGRNSGGSMGAIFTHGGHANTFENNLFIDCDRAIGHSRWNDERWRDYFDPDKHPLMRTRLVEEVDITQPPYPERYPSLRDFFNSHQRPRLNTARNNVAVRCASFLSGEEYHVAEDNLELAEDPGFVNPRRLDFQLRPNSIVYEKLPDFKPIPFALIGLRQNPLRATWPVEHLPARRTPPVRPEIPVLPLDEIALPAGAAPTIDGILGAGEWDIPGQPLALAEDLQGGRARRPGQAWLRYDDEALFVAFVSPVSPESPLVLGSTWGQNDAVEVALAFANRPIAVLWGFPGGEWTSSPEASKDPAAAERIAAGVAYAATVAADRWTAEWRIPWDSLGGKPQAGRTFHFNLSLRQAADNAWTLFRATGGSTWKASEAAILRLGQPLPHPPIPAPDIPEPIPAAPLPAPAIPPAPTTPELVPPQTAPAKPEPTLQPGPILEPEPSAAPAAPEPELVPPTQAPEKPAPALRPGPILEPDEEEPAQAAEDPAKPRFRMRLPWSPKTEPEAPPGEPNQ